MRPFLCPSLLFALSVSACTLGPVFEKPSGLTVNEYTSQQQRFAINESNLALDAPEKIVLNGHWRSDWWTLFHSQALNGLIEKAMKGNFDLQSAQAALVSAQEISQAKQASLLPSIDGIALGMQQKTSGALYGNPNFKGSQFSLYNTSVKVSYTLDVFGAVQRSIESLNAQAEYQRFVVEATFLNLIGNIATAAIQDASLRAQIAILQNIIHIQQEQLQRIKEQQKIGSVAQLLVLAQENNLAQTQGQLAPMQANLAQIRHQLQTLTGQTDQTLIEQFNFNELSLPAEIPLSLPSQLTQQRPDIRAQEALLKASSAEIGVATASIFPNFTLNASMASVATQAGDLFIPGSGIWNVGGNILQPLFHGGEFIHKKRAAVANYQQVLASYHSSVVQALQNVADALTTLEFDNRQLDAQNAIVKTSQFTRNLLQSQWQAGAVSYLTLLEAENNYQQTRLAQLKAKAARYSDSVALFQALGGGWWQRSPLSDTQAIPLPPVPQAYDWWETLFDF